MQRKPIHRGGIVSAGYDADSRCLDIEFDTHRILRYDGVSSTVAKRFLTSASPYSYFRDVIQDEYPSIDLGSLPPKARRIEPKKKGIDDLKRLFGDL